MAYEQTYAIGVSKRTNINGLSMVRTVLSEKFVFADEYPAIISPYIDDVGNIIDGYRVSVTPSACKEKN